jgi:hypothetical protein
MLADFRTWLARFGRSSCRKCGDISVVKHKGFPPHLNHVLDVQGAPSYVAKREFRFEPVALAALNVACARTKSRYFRGAREMGLKESLRRSQVRTAVIGRTVQQGESGRPLPQ